MKKLFLSIIAGAGLIAGQSIQADTGIFGTFIEIGHEGSFQWYGATDPGAVTLPGFNGATLPSVTYSDSLLLSGGDVLTYKGGNSFDAFGNNITGTEMFYRLYEDGGATPSYSSTLVGFSNNVNFNAADGEEYTNTGDQKWGNFADIDLIPFFGASGTYRLDIYFEADWSGDSSGTHQNGTPGSPYSNTFNFTANPAASAPEPSTIGLLALSAAVLAAQRRKVCLAAA
jgi:hypothetical protein